MESSTFVVTFSGHFRLCNFLVLPDVVTCLFTDDTMLLAESEGDLQRVVNEFYSVCKRRKLKVNSGKSKVVVFERREEDVIDFNTAFRVRLPAVVRCRIMLGNEKMEEVS